jgi:hypothetical protein
VIVRVYTPTHLNISVTFLSVVEDILRAFSRVSTSESTGLNDTSGPPSVQQSLARAKALPNERAVKKSVAFYDSCNDMEHRDEEVGIR